MPCAICQSRARKEAAGVLCGRRFLTGAALRRLGGSRGRQGLTLFEVVVALSIFIVAMVPLWHLVNLGTEQALEVQLQAQGALLCHGKMAEVISGAELLESIGATPFKEESARDWQWQMDASEDVTGLWKVRVSVQRQRSDGSMIEVVLSQMVLDPAIRGGTLSASNVPAADSGSTTSDSNAPAASGSATGGSSTGGSTGGAATGGGSTGGASTGGASSGAGGGTTSGSGGSSKGSSPSGKGG